MDADLRAALERHQLDPATYEDETGGRCAKCHAWWPSCDAARALSALDAAKQDLDSESMERADAERRADALESQVTALKADLASEKANRAHETDLKRKSHAMVAALVEALTWVLDVAETALCTCDLPRGERPRHDKDCRVFTVAAFNQARAALADPQEVATQRDAELCRAAKEAVEEEGERLRPMAQEVLDAFDNYLLRGAPATPVRRAILALLAPETPK